MKRILTVIMLVCMVAVCQTACSVNAISGLPSLQVGGTVEAKPGSHSWNVRQGLGSWMSQNASAVFPLDHPDDYPTLSLPQDGVITLEWNTPPDAYHAAYWKEAVWNDGMEAEMTAAKVWEEGFIMLEEGSSAIVAVWATWEKQPLCNRYGDVEYIFKIESNE